MKPDGTVIGTVKQVFHLWRRKYDLFVNSVQFAHIDGPLLTWDFALNDEKSEIGKISRNFSGFAREIFTDTGVYCIETVSLSVDQRAVMLGCAMNADIDYFSRHSSR
jgi:uncharacterized protein YxjI